MEVSSSVPILSGDWSVGEFLIFQSDPESRFANRVTINHTVFTSKLVISQTNYGDSGVYVFQVLESEFGLPPVNFSIFPPPRDIASEFAGIHRQLQYPWGWPLSQHHLDGS